jgi:WD40 repeat protein
MTGNAKRFLRLVAAGLLLALAGCATAPDTPPSVIVEDAHYNQGHVLAFADAADVLASGGSDGAIRLWRLPDGVRVAAWLAHGGSVYGLAFLQRDRLLLSAGYDGHLALWRRDGKLDREVLTPSPVTAMAVNETRGVVLTGHEDGRVRQWRLPDLAPVAEWALHRRYVRAVAIHSPSGTFASSGADRQVHVWRGRDDSRDGGGRATPGAVAETPRALPEPPTSARDLVFTPDGRSLLGGGWFKLFRWNLAAGTLQVLPTDHGGIVTALDLSADGRTLASISRQLDSAVLFLDPETGATRRRFQKHELCGENISLSRNGRWLATTADDGSVRIWDLKNNKK